MSEEKPYKRKSKPIKKLTKEEKAEKRKLRSHNKRCPRCYSSRGCNCGLVGPEENVTSAISEDFAAQQFEMGVVMMLGIAKATHGRKEKRLLREMTED